MKKRLAVLKALCLGLLPLAALVIACNAYVDRRVAEWAFRHFGASSYAFNNGSLMTLLTELIYFLLVPIMLTYVYLCYKNHPGKIRDTLEAISISVPVAFFIKSPLQYFFGRFSPRYQYSNTLLFVRKSSLYGFHFLQGGSFPSGHLCVFSALCISLGLYYRRSFWLTLPALALLAFLLIAFNYHFLSDILAGAYLGVIIALMINLLQGHRRFR